jgi:carboxymethylenebutenolidase
MKRSKSNNKNRVKKRGSSVKLGNIFDKHVKFEFEDKDVESTMKTMVNEPYVHHVPVMTGGVGYNGVYDFSNQVIDELILSFTHGIEIKSMIPGIRPTGKYVELPHVVVMKFRGNKIEHEHIYWDQASLLTQLGVLDPRGLPITGIEQSQKLKELSA